MSKPTLLTWHDFLVPTGFGNVAKNLLKEAHKEYEIEVVGINYKGEKDYDEDKYTVYPTNDPEDQIGKAVLKERLVEGESPDLIFLFQDIFHIAPIAKKIKQEWSPSSKIVSYFPIDGYPVAATWGNIFKYSDVLITYSDWAKKAIKDTYPKLQKPLHKLYHGVDTDTFYPYPQEAIDSMKQHLGWEDKFVALNLNTFQPRKQLSATLRSFSMFAQGYKQCQDCGHRMPLNMGRCELCQSENLKSDGSVKDDVYLYMHTMQRAPVMGSKPCNSLPAYAINAGFDIMDPDVKDILGFNGKNIYKGEVSQQEVNQIYNSVDVNITTSVGEGCGLSLLESAACGVPSIAPKHSAIPEMLGDTGQLIPNKAVFNMNHDGGHMRPIVDEWAMVQALETQYKKWIQKGKKKTVNSDLVDRIHGQFLWKDKREKLMNLFQEALSI